MGRTPKVGSLVTVTWLDSGAFYQRTELPPGGLTLGTRETSGRLAWIDDETIEIDHETPSPRADGFDYRDTTIIYRKCVVRGGIKAQQT